MKLSAVAVPLETIAKTLSNPDGVIKLGLSPAEATRWYRHLYDTRRMGGHNRISDIERDHIRLLNKEGVEKNRIARITGHTRQTVYTVLNGADAHKRFIRV